MWFRNLWWNHEYAPFIMDLLVMYLILERISINSWSTTRQLIWISNPCIFFTASDDGNGRVLLDALMGQTAKNQDASLSINISPKAIRVYRYSTDCFVLKEKEINYSMKKETYTLSWKNKRIDKTDSKMPNKYTKIKHMKQNFTNMLWNLP